MIAHINNTEQGLSVRNKLNEVIDAVNQDLGLIQIVDKDGDFFTDLATATTYIEQFIIPSVITDKSFKEGVFFFTVPNSTAINGYFLIDNITPSITFASLIDRFCLLDLTNAQEFGYMNAGHHILGNGLFQNSAFNLFSGTIEMNSLYIAASGGNFGQSSTGKFIIKGSIGISETANFGANFFLSSTATINANASKYTSNAGGIHGDLQQAIINGCNVFFDGIDKEDKINKSTSVITDQASNIKYPSVKSVYDWVTGLGYLLSSTASSTYQTILTAANFGTFISGLTSKATPVNADGLAIYDSAVSNVAKSLTFTNLKSFLKTYFDTLYGTLKFSYIDTSLGTLSSGASNTLSKSVLIPANTLTSGLLNINGRSVKTGTASFGWLNIYVNTSNSMSGAVLIGQMNNAANNTILNLAMERNIPIQSGSFTAFIVNTIVGSETVITNNISTVTIDWTVDQYIILAVQANSGAESLRANFFSVNQF